MAREGGIKIVDGLAVTEPKTKQAIALLKSVGVEDKKCVLVLGARNDALIRATRNIQGVKTAIAKDLNVHDVVSSEALVIDKDAVGALVEVLET
jgi:large subunit ribosomal protein L4